MDGRRCRRVVEATSVYLSNRKRTLNAPADGSADVMEILRREARSEARCPDDGGEKRINERALLLPFSHP